MLLLHRVLMIEEYMACHPNTILIDSFEAVRIVVSRASTANMIDRICCSRWAYFNFACRRIARILHLPKNISSCLAQPKYFLLQEARSPDQIVSAMDANGITFPVICKPLSACGTPQSHQMVPYLHCALIRPCVFCLNRSLRSLRWIWQAYFS